MPVHLHTTVAKKTDEMLEELAKTYGTKSRVIEKSVETLLRVERVGSCDDCEIKARAREETNLRKALDLMSIGRQTIDGLMEVAVGNKTINDFVGEQKAEARNTIEVLRGSVLSRRPTSFKDFMFVLVEIETLTRVLEIASSNEIDNTVVLRPRIFEHLPEIVALQVSTILEGLQVSFDMRLMGEDIVVKMIRPELHPLRKKRYEESLGEQIEKRLMDSTPGLFMNTLMLVGPAFMNWAAKHLDEPITDFDSFTEDIRISLGLGELPREPGEFVKCLLSAFLKMNWFRQARIIREVETRTLEISFQSTTPSVARLAIVMLSVILATRGWKLMKHVSEHTNANISIQYVGPEDQSLIDQIVEASLYKTIGRQFLDLVPIPREVFNSFASRVYDGNKEKFNEIYTAMGSRVANAVQMMARNDPEKTRKLAEAFVLKNTLSTQPDAEIRFVDDEHFTIIFRKIDLLVLSSQRTLLESMFKELGYEISTTVFQNLLSFKVKRLERPILESVPRKKIMQSLIREMSANSMEEAFAVTKETLDETFPDDYPWTIREVGERILDMYRELGTDVEIEYFEGGFTLKYKTCPYYTLVKSGQKGWLCKLREKTLEYIISRVSHGKKAKLRIIKSLLKNEHPCEYAIFLKGFLEKD